VLDCYWYSNYDILSELELKCPLKICSSHCILCIELSNRLLQILNIVVDLVTGLCRSEDVDMDDEFVSCNLSEVLEMPENDGYIIRKDSTIVFRSPLLRGGVYSIADHLLRLWLHIIPRLPIAFGA
jgi:hypothetical protein